MGEKFGTMSEIWYGVSAEKNGMTPKVGRTWKFSSPSLYTLLVDSFQKGGESGDEGLTKLAVTRSS